MYTNEFEEAFSNFLDRHEYDEAENYLFSMVRLAFAAGWQAAGGAPPQADLRADCPGAKEKPGGVLTAPPGFPHSFAVVGKNGLLAVVLLLLGAHDVELL